MHSATQLLRLNQTDSSRGWLWKQFAPSVSAPNVWPTLKPTVFLRIHTPASSLVSCEGDGFIHFTHASCGTRHQMLHTQPEDYRWCHVKEAGWGISAPSLPQQATIVITAETETAAPFGKESRVKPIRVSVLMVTESKLSSRSLLQDFSRQRWKKKRAEPSKADFQYPEGCMFPYQEKVLIRGKTSIQLFQKSNQRTKCHWHYRKCSRWFRTKKVILWRFVADLSKKTVKTEISSKHFLNLFQELYIKIRHTVTAEINHPHRLDLNCQQHSTKPWLIHWIQVTEKQDLNISIDSIFIWI